MIDNVYLMQGQVQTRLKQDPHGAHELDPDIRALLDHIAVELAEEYARLMEIAATAQSPTSGNAGPGTDEED